MKAGILVATLVSGSMAYGQAPLRCTNLDSQAEAYGSFVEGNMRAKPVPCEGEEGQSPANFRCFVVYGINGYGIILNATRVMMMTNGQLRSVQGMSLRDLAKIDDRPVRAQYIKILQSTWHYRLTDADKEAFIKDAASGMSGDQIIQARIDAAEKSALDSDPVLKEWLVRRELAKDPKQRLRDDVPDPKYIEHKIDELTKEIRSRAVGDGSAIRSLYQATATRLDVANKELGNLGLWTYRGVNPKGTRTPGVATVPSTPAPGINANYTLFSGENYARVIEMANGPTIQLRQENDERKTFAQVSQAYKGGEGQAGATVSMFLKAIQELRSGLGCRQKPIFATPGASGENSSGGSHTDR